MQVSYVQNVDSNIICSFRCSAHDDECVVNGSAAIAC